MTEASLSQRRVSYDVGNRDWDYSNDDAEKRIAGTLERIQQCIVQQGSSPELCWSIWSPSTDPRAISRLKSTRPALIVRHYLGTRG